jgi:hypothetical protein
MNKEVQQKLFFCRCINGLPIEVLNHPVNFVVGIKVYTGMDPLCYSLARLVFSCCKIPSLA